MCKTLCNKRLDYRNMPYIFFLDHMNSLSWLKSADIFVIIFFENDPTEYMYADNVKLHCCILQGTPHHRLPTLRGSGYFRVRLLSCGWSGDSGQVPWTLWVHLLFVCTPVSHFYKWTTVWNLWMSGTVFSFDFVIIRYLSLCSDAVW